MSIRPKPHPEFYCRRKGKITDHKEIFNNIKTFYDHIADDMRIKSQ